MAVVGRLGSHWVAALAARRLHSTATLLSHGSGGPGGLCLKVLIGWFLELCRGSHLSGCPPSVCKEGHGLVGEGGPRLPQVCAQHLPTLPASLSPSHPRALLLSGSQSRCCPAAPGEQGSPHQSPEPQGVPAQVCWEQPSLEWGVRVKDMGGTPSPEARHAQRGKHRDADAVKRAGVPQAVRRGAERDSRGAARPLGKGHAPS